MGFAETCILTCVSLIMTAVLAHFLLDYATQRKIKVLRAVYGHPSCQPPYKDNLQKLSAACNGQSVCDFTVKRDDMAEEQESDWMCRKSQLLVDYACSDGTRVTQRLGTGYTQVGSDDRSDDPSGESVIEGKKMRLTCGIRITDVQYGGNCAGVSDEDASAAAVDSKGERLYEQIQKQCDGNGVCHVKVSDLKKTECPTSTPTDPSHKMLKVLYQCPDGTMYESEGTSNPSEIEQTLKCTWYESLQSRLNTAVQPHVLSWNERTAAVTGQGVSEEEYFDHLWFVMQIMMVAFNVLIFMLWYLNIATVIPRFLQTICRFLSCTILLAMFCHDVVWKYMYRQPSLGRLTMQFVRNNTARGCPTDYDPYFYGQRCCFRQNQLDKRRPQNAGVAATSCAATSGNPSWCCIRNPENEEVSACGDNFCRLNIFQR